MHKQMGNFSNKSQVEILKYKICQRYLYLILMTQLYTAEERINELEHGSINITQTKTQNVKEINIHIFYKINI